MSAIIATLAMTHFTLICVTLYLHRCQAHRGIVLDARVSHVMRFWLWLTTGMRTQEWVAVHRQHHGMTERPGDPHSPVVFGIWRVLLGGAWLYARATRDKEAMQQWGRGTPDDWIERHVYTPWANWGILVMLLLDLVLFGAWGMAVWAVQMIWVPFWAAGVINGLAHWWGYRTNGTNCNSRNIVPWGLVVVGEELHHNHHLEPANPCFQRQWWEIDLGWQYFRLLERLGLAYQRA